MVPWIRGKRLDRFKSRQFPHKEQTMKFVGIDLHKKTNSVRYWFASGSYVLSPIGL